jgi:KRAB domain-containing zinc finger protein
MFSIDLNSLSCSSNESFHPNFKFDSNVVDGKYQCLHCFQNFTKKSDHKRHQEIHKTRGLDPKQKIYSCDLCNKSFLRKDNYKRHVNIIHADSRRFSCEICKKEFKWKSNCERHLEKCKNGESSIPLKFHGEKIEKFFKVKKYKCGECEKTYTRASSLYAHQRNKH